MLGTRDVLATEAALQLAKLIEVNYWLGGRPFRPYGGVLSV